MTEKTLYMIVGGVAVLASAVGGMAGYDMAHAPLPVGLTIIFQPGAIQVMPVAPPSEARP